MIGNGFLFSIVVVTFISGFNSDAKFIPDTPKENVISSTTRCSFRFTYIAMPVIYDTTTAIIPTIIQPTTFIRVTF